MPTENRSSNTDQPQIEAASAAMAQIRTMLGREQRPDQVAAALEACDWSDSPIGNKAIVLSAIQVLRATQPNAEPIAWMVGNAFWWTKEEAERDAAAMGLPVVPLGPMGGSGNPSAWLNTATGAVTTSAVQVMDWDDDGEPVQSLYTHADPGEVERLRETLELVREQRDNELRTNSSLERERDTLRAQLAEAQALLAKVVNSGALSSEHFEKLEAECCAITANAPKCKTCHDQGEVFVRKGDVHYGMQTEPEPVMAACPECAEPSAPKCGNCGASTGSSCNDNGCGYLEGGNGEPSAPVERNDATLIDALLTCEKWFVKHSPTAPLIGGFGDAEHPMLTCIRAALERKPQVKS